jgi:hypothetical protein
VAGQACPRHGALRLRRVPAAPSTETPCTVPDFTSDEYARFAANDRAAEAAARVAEAACGDAGPFPTTGLGIPDFDLDGLPF